MRMRIKKRSTFSIRIPHSAIFGVVIMTFADLRFGLRPLWKRPLFTLVRRVAGARDRANTAISRCHACCEAAAGRGPRPSGVIQVVHVEGITASTSSPYSSTANGADASTRAVFVSGGSSR